MKVPLSSGVYTLGVNMTTLPIFELSICPLPGEIVPLHIFEPRYRRMVSYCLSEADDEPIKPFGILPSGQSTTSKIGTVMFIDRVLDEFPDGRSIILCAAQDKFLLDEFIDHDTFPLGRVQILKDKSRVKEREPTIQCIDKLLKLLELRSEASLRDNLTVDQSIYDTLSSYDIAALASFDFKDRLAILSSETEEQRINKITTLLEFQLRTELMKEVEDDGFENIIH